MPKVEQAVKDEFGRAVKNARALKTWTLDELGRAMDGTSSTSFLSGIENGKRNIGLRTVGRLVKVLDLDESWVARFQDAEVDPDEEVTEVDRRTDRLLEEAKKLNAAGITEEAIIGYAQRTAGEIEDLAQAWTELQNLLEIALDVQTKAAAGSNHADAVDEVLRRSAERSREGDNKAALTGIEVALAAQEAQASRLLESGAEYALLDGDTARAADLLIRKADLEAGGRAEFEHLRGLRDQYYVKGRDKGLNLELRLSIDLARRVLGRATDADERGTAGNDLGNALCEFGQRESGTERLDEAVTAYLSTLEECIRDRVPLDWAMTQMNLGAALLRLGERESGTERLEEAVAAFRSALEEWTRDRVPLDWAMTQMNLGAALLRLGERESGTERLEEAVTAYRSALEERTRDRVPFQWAMTQMNLGIVLATIGERESGTERLEEAVIAFRSALEERTRDRVPLGWALTQMNLGNALLLLGERESGSDRLVEAITAYRSALEEWTRDRVPLDWAILQDNLGALERAFFDKTGEARHLDKAQGHIEAALEVFREAEATYFIKMAEARLAEIEARR